MRQSNLFISNSMIDFDLLFLLYVFPRLFQAENNVIQIIKQLTQLILKLQTITNDREQQMEKLWKEFQDILNDYLHETEEYHNEYIELRQRDDEDTKMIRLHYNEVARATEQIGFLKLDLENLREEQSLHIEELLKYKKLLHEKQRRIKLEMDDGLLKDKNNLRHMVVCSHNAAAVRFSQA